MAAAVIFWTFLLSVCLVGLRCGRTLERAFLAFLVCCTLLTLALSPKLNGLGDDDALFAIDVTIFVVVLAIMHNSRAHWPIWFAGFHTIIVATGLARLLFPAEVPDVYIDAAAFWSLPSLLALVIGTVSDSRRRTAEPVSALSP